MKPVSAPTFVALLASLLNIDAYVIQSPLADQQSCLKQYETCVERLPLNDVQPCRSELDRGNHVVQHLASGLPESAIHVKISPNPLAQTTSNRYDESCEENGDGLYPHPAACTKFLQCTGGLAYEFTCPNDLYFNPKTKVCDLPENVDC